MRTLILIDSNALVHRAFHALPPTLTAPDGRLSNAVYGFTSVLLKMLADLQPDYIAATFDLPGPTFRHTEYEEYKATRQKAPDELYAQIPMVKEMLAAFGIPVFEQAGYEADDVIGTISEQMSSQPDLQTIIVTGDLDTLQLIHDRRVVVSTLRKGMSDTVAYDEDAVRSRYGFAPEQIADFKGLKGDPSDNIPGVKGIGEKTAATLIATFGTLEKVLDAATREKPPKPLTERLAQKIREGRDIALFSKKLATIIRSVPVRFALEDADWHAKASSSAVEQVCNSFGFYSLVKRVRAVLNTAVSHAAAQTLDLDDTRDSLAGTTTEVKYLTEIPASGVVAMYPTMENGALTSVLVTPDGEKVFTLRLPTPEMMTELFVRYPTVVGYDLKRLLKMLPDITAVHRTLLTDVMVGAWLCAPDQRDYALERIYYDFIGQILPQEPAAITRALWRLAGPVDGKLASLGMANIFHDIEMPLIPVLAAMEHRGIRIDARTIDDLLELTAREVNTLETKIWKLADGEFNINSPSQLAEVLFTKLAIRGRVRRTSGGAPSTAAPELEKLRDEHPIIDLVLQYRELTKLKTTYVEPFPLLIATDGRIHTTYNQTGTATGRLSSSDPNLQNIPTRTDLGQQFRAAFIADPAWKLVSLDYSQLELRLVAHIAHDHMMIEAFRAGEDIHTRTASEVLGIAPVQVTKDMRRQAKVLNFGMIYGMGVLGFARAAGVGRDQAKRFMDEYFSRFAGVARYMERTKQQAYDQGYVATLLGRRRSVPDITSRIPQLAAAAERMAINHPIQGTGADLVKLAMIAVQHHLEKQELTDVARQLLQVHDELVLEVRADRAVAVAQAVRKVMEQVYQLDVPLVVDVKVGDSWSAMEPLGRLV